MGLDYSNPDQVVNFRDVGEFVNCIAGAGLLPRGRLYRGGTLRYVGSLDVVGKFGTIFNLQKVPDPEFPDVTAYHLPISNDHEKYRTDTPEVRHWLGRVLHTVEQGIRFPLYVHCLSGKDRTGVVIATFLHILGVPRDCIIDEYLLSDGDVERTRIEAALDGISPVARVFKTVDLGQVKRRLLGADDRLVPPSAGTRMGSGQN
jgi:protein-tyrosine phosphatase